MMSDMIRILRILIIYFIVNHMCIYHDNCNDELIYHDMQYLNPTSSRLSLLLHESKAKPRTSVNNNDNLRV